MKIPPGYISSAQARKRLSDALGCSVNNDLLYRYVHAGRLKQYGSSGPSRSHHYYHPVDLEVLIREEKMRLLSKMLPELHIDLDMLNFNDHYLLMKVVDLLMPRLAESSGDGADMLRQLLESAGGIAHISVVVYPAIEKKK